MSVFQPPSTRMSGKMSRLPFCVALVTFGAAYALPATASIAPSANNFFMMVPPTVRTRRPMELPAGGRRVGVSAFDPVRLCRPGTTARTRDGTSGTEILPEKDRGKTPKVALRRKLIAFSWRDRP